jgi:hypothetical protein
MPDSPSRIVPVRPTISFWPSTEKVTAGSVGARAAPMRPAVVQSTSSSSLAATVMTAAVANVPAVPRRTIGVAAPRNRRMPMCMPPLKRITISATTAIRSTVRIDTSSWRSGKSSDTTAAPSRNNAGAGTGNPLVTRMEINASENPPARMRRISPKSEISLTAPETLGA